MSVFVQYQVPVFVEVDLERGAIVGVHVDDDRAEGPTDVIAVEPSGLTAEETARAIEVAETRSWPMWELGR